MEPKIVRKKITKKELAKIVKENFGDMVKVDVDVKREIATMGGEWHSEGDELLVRDGSSREYVWGVNFHPYSVVEKRIEYVSLINIKPSFGHKKMEIADPKLRKKIQSIVAALLLHNDETLDV